ncbi:MAG: hypothetical protein ACJ74O_18370 [Frankiaceae bacterium]
MAQSLGTSGVVVVPGFIDQRLARMLYATLVLRGHRGEGRRDDHMPTALSFWGDSTLDAFHLSVLPQVEAVAGGPLLPTYCYARLYAHGDTLRPHHDREACEIVASVHVGHRGAAPPPICFATGQAVDQGAGDAVVFHGATIDHWRDAFLGEDFGQVFMNFVRADGPHRGQALDRRYQAFPRWLVPHPEAVWERA